MTNLYQHRFSEGHLNYFQPHAAHAARALLQKYREGIIVGTRLRGRRAVPRRCWTAKTTRTLERIARFYDYLEIQPIGNNAFLRARGQWRRTRSSCATLTGRLSGWARSWAFRCAPRATCTSWTRRTAYSARSFRRHHGLQGRGQSAAAVFQDHGGDAGGIQPIWARRRPRRSSSTTRANIAARIGRGRRCIPQASGGQGDLPALLARRRADNIRNASATEQFANGYGDTPAGNRA